MSYKSMLLVTLLFILFLIAQCGLMEPEQQEGSLQIVLVTEKYSNSLKKVTETLNCVHCIVKKGSKEKYNGNLALKDNRFRGEIKDLEPGNDYSVLLYGKDNSNDIIARGYKSGISVKAGKQETVTISWSSFTPKLVSPANGTTINQIRPIFDWNDVNGATKYEIYVDNSNGFGSPEIQQAGLTISNYTVTSSLPDGTYYWRVRATDALGSWGNWSAISTFTISHDFTLQITVRPSGSGTVSKSPDKASYTYGDQITLTARPATGYRFVRWQDDASGANASTTVTMDGNKNVTALFEQITGLSLTVSSNPSTGGSVTKNPEKTSYTYGETVTLTAKPAAGYEFSHWSEDASGMNATTTVTMTSNKTVTANFTQLSYTLTITVTPSGSGSVSKSPDKASYTYGEQVTLTATPATGYSFAGWQGDAWDTNASTTVTIDDNKSVTAVFEEITGLSLTVSSNPSTGGSVTKKPDKTSYTYGETVTLTATPATGYSFVRWQGGAGGTNASTTITMDGNKSVTAVFEEISGLSLTVFSNPSTGGSVSKNPDKTSYTYGETVILTAKPAVGYEFGYWSGYASGTNATTTVTMTSNKTVTANFTQLSYTLTVTVTPSGGGSVSKSPDKASYTYGEQVTLTITPATGYSFVRWEGDASGTNANTTITMDGNKSVTAVFEEITGLSLTVSSNPPAGGNVTKNPDKTSYTYGETVTLTATPATGYSFVRWQGDAGGTNASTTVTIDGNKNVTALFEKITGLSLTVSSNPPAGGSVTKNPDKTSYTYGETVTLTATPATGYSFMRWQGDAGGTNASTTVTIDGNKNVTVVFEWKTVATPTFSPSLGQYTIAQDVTISCATSGATIHYTTNGTDPTESDPSYINPIHISTTTTLKAKAFKSDWIPSNVSNGTYTITGTVATPTFSPPPGTYTTDQDVTISCATSGATIHYTTNGADPTESDPTYSNPIHISITTILKAKAFKIGWTPSIVISGTYTIAGTVATPSFAPPPGTYTTAQDVTISCTTSGATIHYTTNGADPTESDPIITSSSSVHISSTTTLKVKAYKIGWTPSSVASGTYTITGTIATPTFSPAPGTYTTAQDVTINCLTSDAVIHYTINGLDPTESDPSINSGSTVHISSTTILKAKAFKIGWEPSTVASGTYTIAVATPTFAPSPGIYTTTQDVTISCATSGATIHYTTSGSDPIESDLTYSLPIHISTMTILKARAFKSGWTPSSVASGTYIIKKELVAYYPFNGNANDESGNENNGTVSGATLVKDRFGNENSAYVFDGVDDYIEVPNTNGKLSIVGPFTLCAWVKPYVTQASYASGPIIWKIGYPHFNDDNYFLGAGKSFTVGMEERSSDSDYRINSPQYAVNYWYHVIGIYNGYDLIIYVDGIQQNKAEDIGSIVQYTGSAPLRIGNNLHTSHHDNGIFTGIIDEVQIYNYPLSEEEIISFYNEGSRFNLTTNIYPSNSGIIIKDLDRTSYFFNDHVTLTAAPATGYSFKNWSGDTTGTDPIITIKMTDDKIITANFKLIPYSLNVTITPTGVGSVTKNPDKSTYSYGDQVTLTATPANNYCFVRWEGDVSSTNAITTLTIDENKNITAVFEENLVATPTFSLPPGTYKTDQDVTISCATSGATIHYTINGPDPTESDPAISSGGSITISSTTTLKARAYKNGWTVSNVASGIYTIKETGTLTDIDGNTYQTIKIGNQVWMAENLKVSHYRNGDAIPNITDNSEWSSNLTTGAYCNYGNNANNVATYGRLYNWYAVNDNRNIAPEGWHVPTDEEWKELEMYLGMSPSETDDTEWRGTNEGGKLKETGTTHWKSPNTGATNESGFSALPGGYRSYNGSYGGMGDQVPFWSSTGYSFQGAWCRDLSCGCSTVYRHDIDRRRGFSVRCVKD